MGKYAIQIKLSCYYYFFNVIIYHSLIASVSGRSSISQLQSDYQEASATLGNIQLHPVEEERVIKQRCCLDSTVFRSACRVIISKQRGTFEPKQSP